MSYYVGKNLELRVKAFGLEELQQHLTDVSQGKATWVDGVEVKPKNLDDIDQLRITVYSLLHDVGLKPTVQVRMAYKSLTLWRKREQERADLHIPSLAIQEPLQAGEVSNEDLSEMFEGEEL